MGSVRYRLAEQHLNGKRVFLGFVVFSWTKDIKLLEHHKMWHPAVALPAPPKLPEMAPGRTAVLQLLQDMSTLPRDLLN